MGRGVRFRLRNHIAVECAHRQPHRPALCHRQRGVERRGRQRWNCVVWLSGRLRAGRRGGEQLRAQRNGDGGGNPSGNGTAHAGDLRHTVCRGRCAGRRQRPVHRDAVGGLRQGRDGGMEDGGRHGTGRFRLHRRLRHPHLRAGRNQQDDPHRRHRRQPARRQRGLHDHAVVCKRRRHCHRFGDRHDRRRRQGRRSGGQPAFNLRQPDRQRRGTSRADRRRQLVRLRGRYHGPPWPVGARLQGHDGSDGRTRLQHDPPALLQRNAARHRAAGRHRLFQEPRPCRTDAH